jgi:hypothetical protein
MKQNKFGRLVFLFVFITVCSGCVSKGRSVNLRTATGAVTSEFILQDSVLFDAARLNPRTGYTVQVVDEKGKVITESRLSTDALGRIPETAIWYDMGIKKCLEIAKAGDRLTEFTKKELLDLSYAGKKYSVKIIKDGRLVRKSEFQLSAQSKRPRLYAVNARRCPKPWYLIGEEDIYVVGENFPPNSLIRLWVVPDKMEWTDGDKLEDMTKQYSGIKPAFFELAGNAAGFTRMLWPKELTSVGAYDIVAEVITYPFGFYRMSPQAKAQNVVSYLSLSGFVVQRRQGAAEPLETPLAASFGSPLSHRDHFLAGEDVYVILNSTVHASYVNQTADFYVVPDQSEAGWISSPSLLSKDVTGFVERILIWSCTNFKALVWSHNLTPGQYDVVMDFNLNGQYDSGTDLIDSLDEVGFTVHASVPAPVVRPVCNGDFYVQVCTTINSSTVNVYRNGSLIGSAPGSGGCVNVGLGGTPLTVGDAITAQQVHPSGTSPVSAPVTVTSGGSPVYNTSAWNDPTHQPYNNCYNYGCDIMTDTFAQPGEAHGITLTQADCLCLDVTPAANADGLASSLDKVCVECKHLVALVVDPGNDYHWYRRDENGNWSHKPGSGAATNLDAANNPITNPETANRNYGWLDYSVFCGYFCVDKSQVVIQ